MWPSTRSVTRDPFNVSACTSVDTRRCARWLTVKTQGFFVTLHSCMPGLARRDSSLGGHISPNAVRRMHADQILQILPGVTSRELRMVGLSAWSPRANKWSRERTPSMQKKYWPISVPGPPRDCCWLCSTVDMAETEDRSQMSTNNSATLQTWGTLSAVTRLVAENLIPKQSRV